MREERSEFAGSEFEIWMLNLKAAGTKGHPAQAGVRKAVVVCISRRARTNLSKRHYL